MPAHRPLTLLVILAMASNGLSAEEPATLASPGAAAGAPPNVLLLIGDDLGVANIGAYTTGPDGWPGTPPPTPNIDALAADGVLFRRAWVAPTCTPTRASVFTGRFGRRTGVRVLGDRLPLAETTIAELMSQGGYVSGLFGKWHLGQTQALGGDDAPRTAGWDHHAGTLGGGLPDYYSYNKLVNGVGEPNAEYATTEAVNDALAWIGQQTKPWFCTLAFNAPHAPWHDPPAELHSFDLDGAPNITRYKASIEALDTEIGRLLASIPQSEDVLVIFMGDNGTPQAFVEAPYTSGKGEIYEGGVHVPMIVRAPGLDQPGRQVEDPVVGADLFTTIAAYAGLDAASLVPACVDGVSLKSILDDADAAHPRDVAYTEKVPEPTEAELTVSDGRYKVIDRFGVIEFYDLLGDPYELNDLVPSDPRGEAGEAFDLLTTALATFDGDTNCDGKADVEDMIAVVLAWGPCEHPCDADLDLSGEVDVIDLLAVIQNWSF